MLQLPLGKARNLLFLGAHSDDIEIGCGGTILSLARANPKLNILWVVFSAEGKRRSEARSGAAFFLKGVSRSRVVVKQYPNEFLSQRSGIN